MSPGNALAGAANMYGRQITSHHMSRLHLLFPKTTKIFRLYFSGKTDATDSEFNSYVVNKVINILQKEKASCIQRRANEQYNIEKLYAGMLIVQLFCEY